MKMLNSKIAASLLVAVFMLFPSAGYPAESVAMITDVKGGVHLPGKTQNLAILSYLSPGDEIILDAGAQLVVTYFSQSTEFGFKGPAQVVIQAQGAKALKGSAETRRLDSEKSGAGAKFVQSGKLTFATVEMRALPLVKPTLQSPVNTRISTLTPVFRWKELEDVEKYSMTLMEESGKTIQQVNLATSSWPMQANTALQYGASYRWKVEAVLKSGDMLNSQGGFSVADQATISRIAAQQPPANASFSDQVAYALFLEAEDFRDDARRIWQELAKQRPEDPNLKRRAR